MLMNFIAFPRPLKALTKNFALRAKSDRSPILTAVNIPSYECMTFYLSIPPLRDISWFLIFHKNKHFCN